LFTSQPTEREVLSDNVWT